MKLTQAQIAAIKALESDAGEITAQQVVEAAKPKESPLHDLFEWNKAKASEQWWLHQARLVIGAVRIQVTTQDFTYKAPAYVVDTTVKGSGYRSTMALKGDTESARESLIYTLEVAAGHLRRALDLAVPLGLSGEIDTLIEQVAGVQRVAGKKAA